MSRLVTSTFKDGTGGWLASLRFSDSGGLLGVSSTIFVLYSNYLLHETLSSTSSILSL